MSDFFKEVMPSLLSSRVAVITSHEEAKQSFPPFLANRALAQYKDCLFFANVMNALSHLEPKLQYDFYFYGLRKYKRPFEKWSKRDTTKDSAIKMLQEHYNYSVSKAEMALSLMGDEEVEKLALKFEKGGK